MLSPTATGSLVFLSVVAVSIVVGPSFRMSLIQAQCESRAREMLGDLPGLSCQGEDMYPTRSSLLITDCSCTSSTTKAKISIQGRADGAAVEAKAPRYSFPVYFITGQIPKDRTWHASALIFPPNRVVGSEGYMTIAVRSTPPSSCTVQLFDATAGLDTCHSCHLCDRDSFTADCSNVEGGFRLDGCVNFAFQPSDSGGQMRDVSNEQLLVTSPS